MIYKRHVDCIRQGSLPINCLLFFRGIELLLFLFFQWFQTTCQSVIIDSETTCLIWCQYTARVYSIKFLPNEEWKKKKIDETHFEWWIAKNVANCFMCFDATQSILTDSNVALGQIQTMHDFECRQQIFTWLDYILKRM